MEASLTLCRKRWSHLCVCVLFFPCPSQTAAPCSARPAGVSPALVCHRPWCVTGGRDCRGVTGAAAVPGAAQGSVLRSRREGGTEAGEGTDFPRKLLCPADTEPGTRVFWAVQAVAAAPGQPWVSPGLGARLADRTVLREPAGKVQRVFSHFFPLPLPLPRQQTSGSFLRN